MKIQRPIDQIEQYLASLLGRRVTDEDLALALLFLHLHGIMGERREQ
jgi:hypothetical protein